MRAFFLILFQFCCFVFCTIGYSGGIGLQAKTNEVHFGIALQMSQPVGEFGGPYGGTASQARFFTGVGIKFSAMMPMTYPVFMRTSVSLQHFGGRARVPHEADASIQCNTVSLECDLLYFFNKSVPRSGAYAVCGVSVDSLRYDLVDHGMHARTFDGQRLTDNGINVGVGKSYREENFRFTVELLYHKSLVHDADAGTAIPRADFISISYGLVF